MAEYGGLSLIARDTGALMPGQAITVADLAQPVRVVPAAIRAAELDEIFRMDAQLRWVVLEHHSGPILVQRSAFEVVMAGRLGYGRLLHAKHPVHDLARIETLVFDPATSVIGAASSVIDHRQGAAGREGVLVIEAGVATRVVAVNDIFERLALHFAHQSLHDPMTGLPNRLFLMQRLADLGATAQAAVLMYADLDRFKDVNDQLGHAAGDQVLAQFGERLRSISRQDDLIARLGGDEFAILSSGAMTPAQSRARAERLVLAAAAPFVVSTVDETGVLHEHEVSIGASVGVAHSDRGVAALRLTSLDVLLKQADLAMYRAKSHGRGRVEHFAEVLLPSGADAEATRHQRSMERRLRTAIDEGLLTLHFQPVVALPGAEVVGVEALARWQDPELGSVPPDQFVPLAERTGLILDLGRWVLRAACEQAAAWQDGGHLPWVSVNISPIEIAQPTIVEQVADVLAATGLAPHRLCIEVTETAAIVDFADTRRRLEQLAALGVRIALDDFGTGHSSLTMLRDLPVDVVKIDRSFVHRMSSSTADLVLLRLVVDTAHSLGMTVCAEGVEDATHARRLIELGCDTAQGWYFGMPEPASQRLTAIVHGLTPAPTPDAPDASDGSDASDATMLMPGSDELIVVSTPDHVISYVSATAWTILGWTSAQMVGTSLTEHLHPDDQATFTAPRAQPRLAPPVAATLRAMHRDGSIRWLSLTCQHVADDAGTVSEVLTIAHDVTDAVTARLALEECQQQFRLAFDDAPIAMALTLLDGTFVRVNAAFERLLGRSAGQLLDSTVADITHPDDLLVDEGNLEDLRAGSVRVHHVDKRYVHADGRSLDVSVSASLVGDPGSGTSYLISHVLSR